jgi:hypothetical protein
MMARKPKKTRAEILDRKQRFINMCTAGFSREDIADVLDIGTATVCDRAKKLNVIVPHTTRTPNRNMGGRLRKRSVPGDESLVKR